MEKHIKNKFMKVFFITVLVMCSIIGYAQNTPVYYDDRDSNGTGLVLYSNGIFECDYQYFFLKSRTHPPLFLSRGTWHPIDANLIELKSFDEYKSRIVNTISYNDPQIADSVKIRVYNKEGDLIGFAYLDGNHDGKSYGCSIQSIYAWDNQHKEYYKMKDIIQLPYGLTYDFDYGCNQYYFVLSTYQQNDFVSYHNCIIKIDSEKKHFRVVENRECIYRFHLE